MDLKNHAITAVFGLTTAIASAIIVAVLLAPPQSRIEIIADWLELDSTKFITGTEISKLLRAAGVSLDPDSTTIEGSSRFGIVVMAIRNSSAITAKEVQIQSSGTILVYNSSSNELLYRPKADGIINVGRFLPNEKRVFICCKVAHFRYIH